MPRLRRPLAAISIACAAVSCVAGITEASAFQPDSTTLREIPPAPIVRAAEWETLSAGLPEEARLRRIVVLRYNRVDGPAAILGAAFQTGRSPAPILFAQGGYAYSRERWLFEAGFTAPFGDRPLVSAGGAIYRRTATEDGWIVTEGENTLFALFARTDYRDHYESRGGEAHVSWSPGSDFELRGGARLESQRSLTVRTRVALTGREPVFRANPPIQDGDEEAFTIGVRVGPEDLPIKGWTRGDAVYERSGEPLKGDFEYGRLRGAVRHRSRLSPSQDFRARLIAGTTLTGALPFQKIWHVGGIGTLRGHDYKAFAGDQFFVATAEFYQRARKNVFVFGFLDSGAAWFGSENLDRQRPALDGGVGVRIATGPAAVTVAKNLRDTNSKLRVGVRLGETF